MALPHAILNHWGNCLIGITATLYFHTFPHKSSHIKYVIGERVSCDILNSEDLDHKIFLFRPVLLLISEKL